MVYRVGQRVRPKLQRVKLLAAAVSGILVLGTLATAYADSHDTLKLPNTLPPMNHKPATTQHKPTPQAKPATGSSHAAASNSATLKITVPARAGLRSASCVLFPPKNPGLSGAMSPQLRKLAQYEQLCNGNLIGRSSFFAPTPSTVAAAQSDAADMAAKLKEYAQFGITPLVFLEPDTDNGTDLDLTAYKNGNYDSALDAYFAALKADGVTDSMMGMWVLLPEGNLPVWSSVDPQTFTAVVTKTAQLQKKYFPHSQSSLMLDSESYPSASSWSGGAYTSLLPYVQGIPKGLIDSFGLQGFPWSPPANQPGSSLSDPRVYLRADLAAHAARALGTNNIWFNTGTFHQMYTKNTAETVTATPLQRQAELAGVVTQAKALQSQGFTVAVHLFAQDKASTAEAVDWSYWQVTPSDTPDTVVLTTFVRDLKTANIPLWLFDTYDQ